MNLGATSSLLGADEVLHELTLAVAIGHPLVEARVTQRPQRRGYARSRRHAGRHDIVTAEGRPGRPRGLDEPLDVAARRASGEPRRQELEIAQSPPRPPPVTRP